MNTLSPELASVANGSRDAAKPATPRRLARGVIIGVIAIATLAYYFWTAMLAPGGMPRIHGREYDHFNLLSRGFQKGHLYLDEDPPPELLQAPNPYDPTLRTQLRLLHDASYYRGKYYIYFGPAPVLTLLLPFSLATGRDLPLPYAVWFFTSVGTLTLFGLLLFLQRRYYPQASLWTISAALIALGGATMVVALLRRAHIWELSAASGFCYFVLGLYCVMRALHSERATRWAIAGGLALGLAVASRPNYLLGSVLFVLPWLFQLRAATPSNYRWPAVLGAAIACGLPLLGLLAYNYARFGNPLEFGINYQLTAVIESQSRHFSLEYVPFNFRVYFLSALRWVPYFPFHNGIVVPPFPVGHGGYEYTIGLLPNLPFAWLGAAAVAGLLTARLRRDARTALWLSVAVFLAAGVLSAAFLLFFFGSCIRYMVDFVPSFMVVAAIGLFEAEAWLRGMNALARAFFRALGLGLAGFSTAVAAASVVNFYEPVAPEPYRPVARALNYPYFLRQQRLWPDFQPLEISVSFPVDRTPRQEALATVTRQDQPLAMVFVEYLPAEKVRLGYREATHPGAALFSPAVTARTGTPHALRLSIGGPYSAFDGQKSRLRAELDQLALWDVAAVAFDVYPGKLKVGAEAACGSPAFTGVIHDVRRITMPAVSRPAVGGIRARITFTAEMIGRTFPLIATGRTKAGDVLVVRVQADGKLVFGYDHWGAPLLTSPEIPFVAGETRVVEFWIPPLAPAGKPELIVQVDGAPLWRREAPAFPFAAGNLFLGSNPFGASTAVLALENAVFEELQLPVPSP